MKKHYFCYSKQKLNSILLLCTILWLSTNLLHAQDSNFYYQNFLESSISIQKSGMLVLGSWALMNIISGIPGTLMYINDVKYFYQMNTAWNVINLGIATIGYIGAMNGYNAQSSVEILAELQKFDRILLINAGLDFAYIGTGIWLWKKGIKDESYRLKGYGKSVILQGTFLFLFDTILYLVHHQKTTGLQILGGQLSISGTGVSFTF